MKKIGLILAVCLAYIGLYGAHADDVGDIARAAVRRGTNTTTSVARQKSDTPAVTARPSGNKTSTVSSRTAIQNTRTTNTLDRTQNDTTQSASVVARTPTPSVVARTSTTTTEPKKTLTRTTTTTPSKASVARTAMTRTNARAAKTTATREDILQRDFSKCKTVFFECMDEFCANKDTQLKRCACSARSSDFDDVKKQLDNIDNKMLDFNQRLLTVNMDREDAAALSVATEGEKAFYDTVDTSESKRTLDSIAKKLNTSFESSNFSPSLNTVFSWSLDIDSVFDNVDSLRGASAVAKSGTALYSAALPVCREMAAEVCSETDLSLAESGYQLTIEQDCNTVAKTYQSQIDSARTKVLESGALLDISRLDIYQKRNADDLLSCKKKMLAMLTDSTVCGEDMGKCLDITGQYIDPTTGEAFLSTELSELNNLISRPTGNEKWTEVRKNEPFVTFLNSKKSFLEPAMENCQNIADMVWDAFLEDALAQIKIAQTKKLAQVIQSCTTLTAQCLTDASSSITKFDSRALSIFGVMMDTTQNAMCDNILTSCTALLATIGDENLQWYTGMTGIQTDITFDTIKKTCREVGRACIIQSCSSTSGNFGLCENIDTSVNRKSIISQRACWQEVWDCVASAGTDALLAIFEQNHLGDNYKLYRLSYPTEFVPSSDDNDILFTNDEENKSICKESADADRCIFDLCWKKCDSEYYNDTDECRVCRLTESIWGNCELSPDTRLDMADAHNMIKISKDPYAPSTLLQWFAVNTGTGTAADSCRDTTCGIGLVPKPAADGSIICTDKSNETTSGDICLPVRQFNNGGQCCAEENSFDNKGNCCTSNVNSGGYCLANSSVQVATFHVDNGNNYYGAGDYTLYCAGTLALTDAGVQCNNGRFYMVYEPTGSGTHRHYMNPYYENGGSSNLFVKETFKEEGGKVFTRRFQDGQWKWTDQSGSASTTTPVNWQVSYGN